MFEDVTDNLTLEHKNHALLETLQNRYFGELNERQEGFHWQ